MWYAPPATVSPAASADVVHLAGRFVIVKSVPALVTVYFANAPTTVQLIYAVTWYAPTDTLSLHDALPISLTPSARTKPLPDPVVNGAGSASPYTLLFATGIPHVCSSVIITSCLALLAV